MRREELQAILIFIHSIPNDAVVGSLPHLYTAACEELRAILFAHSICPIYINAVVAWLISMAYKIFIRIIDICSLSRYKSVLE